MSPASTEEVATQSHTSEQIQYDVLPGYDGDYPFGMSAAHRKPAYEIGTPSITWRMAFWKPEPRRNPNSETISDEAKRGAAVPANPHATALPFAGPTPQLSSPSQQQFPGHRAKSTAAGGSESLEEYDQWILQIEYLILHVYDRLNEHRDKTFPKGAGNTAKWLAPELSNLQPSEVDEPDYLRLLRRKFRKECSEGSRWEQTYKSLDNPRDTLKHGKTRYEAVHIDGVWESLPLDIRFEVSDEYFTITATIDFSRMKKFAGMGERRRSERNGEFTDRFRGLQKGFEKPYSRSSLAAIRGATE